MSPHPVTRAVGVTGTEQKVALRHGPRAIWPLSTSMAAGSGLSRAQRGPCAVQPGLCASAAVTGPQTKWLKLSEPAKLSPHVLEPGFSVPILVTSARHCR